MPAQPCHAAPKPTTATLAVADLLATRSHPAAASRARKVPFTRVQLAQRHARARARVVAYARAQRGKWYRYGAAGPNSFDCSGLTLAAYRTIGIRLPHSSRAQAGRGVRVSARNARVGDLVAYGTHIGILSGRWRMVDAPGRGRRIAERAVYRSPAPTFRRIIG